MNEKSLPLDPNQLFLFSKEEMSSMKISRLEEEVYKSKGKTGPQVVSGHFLTACRGY